MIKNQDKMLDHSNQDKVRNHFQLIIFQIKKKKISA